MISFQCPTCGKPFSVPDAYAGRTARCKGCSNELKIPAAARSSIAPPVSAPSQSPAEPKLSPRARRLLADAEQIKTFFSNCDHIRVNSAEGDPPDVYEVEYTVMSMERDPKGKPRNRHVHLARIQLTADYPRLSPQCTLLTPIFHPNFNESTICIGDHWTAGERLADIIVRIAEMLSFQAYNIQSPLDGEAAMWADLNQDKLPTDKRNMRPAIMDAPK